MARVFLGYLLGFLLFVAGVPLLMWWVAGTPAFADIPTSRLCLAALFMLAGLALSIWSIVYMKRVGEGNPFDAMGHAVAPRTRKLMTDGPYRLNRNPMLTGTLTYYFGFGLALWSLWALVIFLAVLLLMMIQVLSEEQRLEAEFGQEYLDYQRRTRRF